MFRYIFPTTCQICLKRVNRSQLICIDCHQKLPHRESYSFRKKEITCYAAFHYSDAIKQLITDLKFSQKLQHTRLLGQLLLNSINQHYSTLPQLIIPVPLHKQRLRQRGFNQALEIAKVINKSLQMPIDIHSVIRHKATRPQAQCTASQREQNIKNAFRLKKLITVDHIILLDDVITSGNTLRECIHCINKSRTIKIDSWSIAKAMS